MAGGQSEAERLKLCRLSFERAMRDGVMPAAAREALAKERWADADRRLADLRAGRCGTEAPAEPADRPQHWWQREDL